jgi:hypothetical protein
LISCNATHPLAGSKEQQQYQRKLNYLHKNNHKTTSFCRILDLIGSTFALGFVRHDRRGFGGTPNDWSARIASKNNQGNISLNSTSHNQTPSQLHL